MPKNRSEKETKGRWLEIQKRRIQKKIYKAPIFDGYLVNTFNYEEEEGEPNVSNAEIQKE